MGYDKLVTCPTVLANQAKNTQTRKFIGKDISVMKQSKDHFLDFKETDDDDLNRIQT